MNTNQKLITVCIPAYNSEEYLHYAVDSLIPFGEDVEIIIIDDGSKDKTGEIADKYAAEHPFIKAVHQPNGGHGEGINHGLKLATGIYFRVLDSDDWVDHDGFAALLKDVKEQNCKADLYFTDYTYWHGRDNKDATINFNYLFKGKDYDSAKGGPWSCIKKFRYDRNLTLHTTMYRTSTLRESGVHCPGHVSYEDNYFIYAPMAYVKEIRYVPVSVYQYLTGRDGQSMATANLVKKYKDFLLDGKLIFDSIDIYSIKDKATYKAVYHHLIMNMILSVMWAKYVGTKESKAALKDFYRHCKTTNKRQYRKIRRHFLIWVMNLPLYTGTLIVRAGFHIGHKIVKFN